MLSVFFKPNCLFCNSFINISIVLKKNVKKRTTLKQRSVAKWIIFFIHKRFTEIMYSMTSSSPPKLQQQQVNASLRDLLCEWICVFLPPSRSFVVFLLSCQTLKHFLQPEHTDASKEIPHYVIAKATYRRRTLPRELCSARLGSAQPVTLARKFPLHELCGRAAAAAAAPTTAASCSDAAAYTKETLIAPRDTTGCRLPGWKTVMLHDMPRNKHW